MSKMKTMKEVQAIDKFCEENDLYSDLEITSFHHFAICSAINKVLFVMPPDKKRALLIIVTFDDIFSSVQDSKHHG